MKLSIIATPNRLGFAEGSAWQYYKEKVLKDVDYELIDAAHCKPPMGDRVLMMGSNALSLFAAPGGDLFKLRGSLLTSFNKPATCTFDLQDAYDFKPSEEGNQEEGAAKDSTSTQKKNWFFWIEADTRKILNPAKPVVYAPQYSVQPSLANLTARLNILNNATIYLDIETDMASDTLTVIGFAVNDSAVFVVPVYTFKHTLAYDKTLLLRFMASLSSALLRNRVVIHNAMFDLAYLATHYRLPFGKDIFDTMLCHKRCFSEVEKSLGHAISYWTWQPYHKDVGTQVHSHEQQQLMYVYNAKDVHSMRLVYKAQLARLADDVPLANSVAQANSSIYPYLLAGLKGFNVDKVRLAKAQVTYNARLAVLIRIIRILTGDPKFNPNSPKQICKYFHDKLGYKVVERTATGAASLGGKAMYVLLLKYPNPLITLLLYYRDVQKESTMSTFHEFDFPWNLTDE